MNANGKPDFVFKASNTHATDLGDSPRITTRPGLYCSYFESDLGDQWVFVFDRETKCGELRGGDCGWDEVFEVVDGTAPGLILSPNEATWLKVCWKAASGISAESPALVNTKLVLLDL